jgi:hypothetical protein
MGGKRKSTEDSSELDANDENSAAQQRGAPLSESENGGSGRSSGRARKAVKAYDPSTAFESPSKTKATASSPLPTMTAKRVSGNIRCKKIYESDLDGQFLYSAI